VKTTHHVPEPAARNVEVEEARPFVTGHRERVHDLGRDEHPGPRPDAVLAVLEPERELALHDEEGLRVPRVGMERRTRVAVRIRADLDRADLLDVDEKGHVARVAGEALAVSDLDHDEAA
jgi:hypothetical protein